MAKEKPKKTYYTTVTLPIEIPLQRLTEAQAKKRKKFDEEIKASIRKREKQLDTIIKLLKK